MSCGVVVAAAGLVVSDDEMRGGVGAVDVVDGKVAVDADADAECGWCWSEDDDDGYELAAVVAGGGVVVVAAVVVVMPADVGGEGADGVTSAAAAVDLAGLQHSWVSVLWPLMCLSFEDRPPIQVTGWRQLD